MNNVSASHATPQIAYTGDFGYTLPGIIAAILVAVLFAAYAYALHAWPVQTLLWSAPVFAAWFVFKHPLATLAMLLAGTST